MQETFLVHVTGRNISGRLRLSPTTVMLTIALKSQINEEADVMLRVAIAQALVRADSMTLPQARIGRLFRVRQKREVGSLEVNGLLTG